MEIRAELNESSLIQAVEETKWYPKGLPKDEEQRDQMLRDYLANNVVYRGMNDMGSRQSPVGLWQIFVPRSYEAARRELGESFAHQFFTRSIGVGVGVHRPFTRTGVVNGNHLGFRVLPGGNIQVRSSLEQFRRGSGRPEPSLEMQWGLRDNSPGTVFLVESALKGRSMIAVNKLFTELKGLGGGRGLIPGIKDVVATYSHDEEFEPEAVIQLALPDPEIRSRVIQNFKDLTTWSG